MPTKQALKPNMASNYNPIFDKLSPIAVSDHVMVRLSRSHLLTFMISLLCLTLIIWGNRLSAEEVNHSIRLQSKDEHLLLDAQAILPMTSTMEDALMHGIPLEYSLEAKIIDADRPFWRNPVGQQKIRVRLSYDLLKQTYLLTNLTLHRVTSDRDLTRSLLSLGHLQDLPMVNANELEAGHTYHIWVVAKLEPTALPNALRLATLFDSQWLNQSPPLHRYWTAP